MEQGHMPREGMQVEELEAEVGRDREVPQQEGASEGGKQDRVPPTHLSHYVPDERPGECLHSLRLL
jgi:hypothetical protein